MPINPVTQEWYGKKATKQQRAAYDDVLQRMQGHRQTKEEADKALKQWIAAERVRIQKRIDEAEKSQIETYIAEQVQTMTALLEKEERDRRR